MRGVVADHHRHPGGGQSLRGGRHLQVAARDPVAHGGEHRCDRAHAGPAGADDVQAAGERFEVTCDPAKYRDVLDLLGKAGVRIETSQITRIAKNTVEVTDVEEARKILKLMERLDDHDDVQNVSSNFNIPDAVMAQVGEE